MAFVVPGQAAVRGEPGERALHCPAARNDRQPALPGRLADHLDGGAQDGAGPLEQPAGERAVGDDEPDRAGQTGGAAIIARSGPPEVLGWAP